MGTQALVKVKDCDSALYVHYDGYPEHMLPWLQYFNKDFTDNRGIDAEYKFAQLLRSSVRDAEQFNLSDSKYTGFGVLSINNMYSGDYVYMLNDDGTVTIER